LVINGAVFRQDLDDFQVNTFDGVNFIIGNLGEVENRGFELELTANPLDGLNINLGVTYAETEEDGIQIPFAPEWVATGAVNYRHPLSGSVDLIINANARYLDDQVLGGDNDPIKTQDAYTLVNGRIGLDFADYGIQASIFGRNIFDEDYALVIANAVFQGGSFTQFPGEPSMYGIQITKDF
jgi:outer membrane receptor protein involved in Fe transport